MTERDVGWWASVEPRGRSAVASAASLAVVVTWAVFGLANIASHRSYEGASVAVFALTAGVLAAALAMGRQLRMPGHPFAVIPLWILAAGSLIIFQPTYMSVGQAWVMRLTVFLCTLVLGLLWLQRHVEPTAPSLLCAVVVLGMTAWFPIRGVPQPGNDVWYLLQQSNEGLVRGENMYRMTWTGVPPGQVTDVFTYLPMSSVLLAPARWLTGDVRWGLAFLVLISALLLLVAARTGRVQTQSLWFAPACLLVLTPGHALLVEMSWTEPLLLFLLVGAMLAIVHGRGWMAVLCLALALASKQHVWLLVPLFVFYRPFGLRRAGFAILGALSLCLPWVLADPRAMYADTVGSYLSSKSSERSSTLSNFFERIGVGLPSWLAAGLVLIVVAYCCYCLRRSDSGSSELCLAAALTLLVGNLLNKQSYYNQWWLVGSLTIASLSFTSARTIQYRSKPTG